MKLVGCVLFICSMSLVVTVAYASTAYISQTPEGQFAAAIRDPAVTDIVLLSDAGAEGLPVELEDPGVPVSRNITVTSQDPSSIRVFNMDFGRRAVNICSKCRVVLQDLVVANDRKGDGPYMDFFTADPGGQLVLVNVFRLRPACLAPNSSIQQASQLPRSPAFPGNQTVSIVDVTFRGKAYKQFFHMEDVSLRVQQTFLEGIGWTGGYDLYLRNCTRLCNSFVDPTCLNTNTADVCVAQAIDAILRPPADSSKPQLLAIAIAVPVVVGVVAMLVCLVLVLRHRKRMKRGGETRPLSDDQMTKAELGLMLGNDARRERTTVPNSLGSTRQDRSPHTPSDAVAASTAAFSNPASKGLWQVKFASSNAEGFDIPVPGQLLEGDNQVADIRLSILLGAGAFGRVFLGIWHDLQVAVKIINHKDGSGLSKVAQEAELLLSLNHQNVVTAHGFLTCTWVVPPRSTLQQKESLQRSTSGPALHSDTWIQLTEHSSGVGHKLLCLDDCHKPGQQDQQQHEELQHNQQQVQQVVQLPLLPGTLQQPQHQQLQQLQAHSVAAVDMAAGPVAATAPATADKGALADDAFHAASSSSNTHSKLPALAVDARFPSSQPLLSGQLVSTSIGSSTPMISSNIFPPVLHRLRGSSALSSPDEVNALGSPPLHGDNNAARTWIIQEYCDGGPLYDLLLQLKEASQGNHQGYLFNLLLLMEGAAQGLAYIHARQVVHGDLNARNVLVRSCCSPPGVVAKISDFGLSRIVTDTHRTTDTYGTISHMPPERLQQGHLSPAADVYAFGIMMWETWTGQMAYKGLQMGQVCEAVVLRDVRPEAPADMPPEYRQLMTECWARDPATRPTMAQVAERLQLLLTQQVHPEDYNSQEVLTATKSSLLDSAAGISSASDRSLAAAQRVQQRQQQLLQQQQRQAQMVASDQQHQDDKPIHTSDGGQLQQQQRRRGQRGHHEFSRGQQQAALHASNTSGYTRHTADGLVEPVLERVVKSAAASKAAKPVTPEVVAWDKYVNDL